MNRLGIGWITLAVSLCSWSCSSASKSDSSESQLVAPSGLESSGIEEGGGAPENLEGDESSTFPDLKPGDGLPPVSVQTILDPPQVQAGYESKVLCAVLDEENNVVDVPTTFSVVNTTALFFTTDAGVSFEKVGVYEVECRLVDGSMKDEYPANIEVIAGDATVVETELDTHLVTAGDKVNATCTTYDAFGNLNEWAKTELFLAPGESWVAQGNTVKVVGAGIYDAACIVPATGAIDTTPEILEVVPGVPRTIQTILEPYAIEAGQSSALTCRVLDDWNNPIDGFPISVFKAPEVTLNGTILTTVVSGLYSVKCVPASDPWEYFDIQGALLQVLPGPPSEIYVEQVPPKAVYQKLDTVDLLIFVLDQYANIIPDSPVDPLTVEPEVGIKGLGPTTFKFQADGVFVFGIVSTVDPTVNLQLEILVDGEGPAVVIETPARGATLNGKPAVTVEGVVQDEVAGVFSLDLNGQDVDVKPDGSFSHIVLANHGMNILRLKAVDLGGTITETSRAFYFSTEWFEADPDDLSVGEVPDSFQVWLGQEFLDDGDHSLPADDMASFVEKLMGDFLVGNVLQNPIAESGPYKVYAHNIQIGAATVGLDAFDGGVAMDISIPNFSFDLDLKGKCTFLFVDLCPDFSGDLSMNSIDLSADIMATMVDGEAQFSVSSIQVSIKGLDLDIDGILGWLFDFLIDFILDFFVDDLEEAFENAMSDEIADLFEELVSSFAFNSLLELKPLMGVGETVNVNLTTGVGTVVFTDAGGLIGLDANATSSKKVAQKPLGSLGRAACLTQGEPAFEAEGEYPFGIGLHDDVFNRILFSMWWGGLFNMEGDLGDISDEGDTEFLPGLESVTIKTVFFAAPIVTSCNPAQTIKLQIADMFVDVLLSLGGGMELQLGLFASIEAEAEFKIIDAGDEGETELALDVNEITDSAFEIVSITPGWESAKAEFEALIADAILDGLLDGLVGESLTSFPVPSIDISDLDPGAGPGEKLNLELEALYRQGGYSVLYGLLK